MEKLKLNIQLFAISPSSLTSTAKAGGNFYAILSSTQNVDNLTTTVTLKAKGVSSGGYYLYGRGFYYKIGNGNWVTLEESYSQSSYVTKSSYSVEWWKTFTFTVPHNPDGTAPTLQIRLKHGFQYGMSDERWNEQASSQYNASHTDFNITLSDIVVPVEETNIRLGLNSIQKMYLGNNLISAMWLGLKKIFPSESSWRDRYQEIEYIESTGTQHITIDYFLDNQCSVEYKALFKNKTTTPAYEAIFSNGTYSSSFFYNTIPNDNNKFSYLKKQTDRSFSYGFSVTYNKIYRINNDYKNNKLYVYDENNTNLYTYTLSYTSITARTNKLSIFSENGSEKTMLMQLYSFVISKNGDDIINLVPVYRRSDNKPGMYDVVNDTFYINQGSGEFTYGPEVYTEDDFIKVEYLQSSGTQYINTNQIIKKGSRLDIDWSTPTTPSGSQFLYGVIQSGRPDYARYFTGIVRTTNTCEFKITGVNNTKTFSFTPGTKNVCSIINDYPGSVTMNGVTQSYTDSSLYTIGTNYKLFLFASNDNSVGPYLKATCSIYKAKLYYNNTLECDLVPVYRKSDNKPGMFDKVNNKFYVNSGTGEFAVGPDIN